MTLVWMLGVSGSPARARDLLVADVEAVDTLLEPVDVDALKPLGAGVGGRQGPLSRSVPELVVFSVSVGT